MTIDRPARRFVSVDGRRVHYRRVGEGPPLVMLHGSPGNSEMMLHEMAACAPHFTCIALDTPGFGDSDALAGDELTVSDLAHATADAMAALGLPPCLLFGTHTGAAIALELGARRPERASGLILDAVPLFTPAEIEEIFRDFFVPLVVDPLGGHFISTWMRFRDQFTWFPWLSRNVTRLNPVDRPTPAEIDHWVMMYYRSCKSYIPAYRAACYYGPFAYDAVQAVQLPAVFMASAEDMLFSHLDRLPALKEGQRIERLSYDPPAKYAAIARFSDELSSEASPVPKAGTRLVGRDPAVQFIDTPDGQVYIRCYGDPTKPAVFLLHDAPGTGLALDATAQSLRSTAWIIVPDLPGNGESEAPRSEAPVIEASARAISAIADALALKRFTIAATGCGCAVAARFAALNDPRLNAVLLEDVPVPDEATAIAIAPDIALSATGAHWIEAWLTVRDSQIYKPWFDGRVQAHRRTQGNFEGQWLHDQTFALMKARATYHLLPRAAFRFDGAAALALASVPVKVATDGALESLILTSLKEDYP